MIVTYYQNNQLNKSKTVRKYLGYVLKESLHGRRADKLIIRDKTLESF